MTLNIFPEHNKKEKKVQIELDEYTEYASKYFDYEFDGVSVFEAWGKPVYTIKALELVTCQYTLVMD